jgi:hypothetical protein
MDKLADNFGQPPNPGLSHHGHLGHQHHHEDRERWTESIAGAFECCLYVRRLSAPRVSKSSVNQPSTVASTSLAASQSTS